MRRIRSILAFVGRDGFYGFLASQRSTLFRDEDFAGMYSVKLGRPSVPPSLLATALVLQACTGISDEEARQRACYDLRWKVALGIEVETRHRRESDPAGSLSWPRVHPTPAAHSPQSDPGAIPGRIAGILAPAVPLTHRALRLSDRTPDRNCGFNMAGFRPRLLGCDATRAAGENDFFRSHR